MKSITIPIKDLTLKTPEDLELEIEGEKYPYTVPDAEKPIKRNECLPKRCNVGECEHCADILIDSGDCICPICKREMKPLKEKAYLNRPCPWVSCKFNTWAEITRFGSIKVIRKNLRPWDIDPKKSCILDTIDDHKGGEITLDKIGSILNITRERVRQIEFNGLQKMSDDGPLHSQFIDLEQ
jgi:hypothetical protein